VRETVKPVRQLCFAKAFDAHRKSGYDARVRSSPAQAPAPLVSIEERAADDLRFIRQTLERSATFTAVPGLGGVAMGVLGMVAAVVAVGAVTPERWLAIWIATAVVASIVGLVAMRRKARRAGVPLTGGPARQFALSFGTPVLAAALLTMGLWQAGAWNLMPALWLLLYGTAVLAGGAFSVPVVRLLGVAFLVLGVGALLTPPAWGNVWLGIGFGALQALVGLYVAKEHGG
jgi:hypothetical protein